MQLVLVVTMCGHAGCHIIDLSSTKVYKPLGENVDCTFYYSKKPCFQCIYSRKYALNAHHKWVKVKSPPSLGDEQYMNDAAEGNNTEKQKNAHYYNVARRFKTADNALRRVLSKLDSAIKSLKRE
ncbi:hypothetical protein D8B26_001914 [Coccidioides posadasii str. Silveira]|uniref:Uncharacterized protein n=2 Tax=Coccidioides posadasii TaxID=199306 RepID=E9CWW0_COCPS|nr:conserved hypothetical protein [Coccidioides posadasii str. Silveira]KMM65248.1 hypothetical protein CPAG_01599 [Coccidioides posadasii RMSCC 3488]QVM07210.1 hypothetical protein D8B26_001914 [Coccidioides posadasii str. Silveira]